MSLILNSKHAPGRSIQDIYLELANDSTDSVSKETGANMLKIIEEINKIFVKTSIWALTSHYTLILQTKDDWKSDWHIRIGSLGKQYQIEYLMPEQIRPWPYAYVNGIAFSLDEAKRYLLIAMKECGAWESNSELANSLEC